MTMKDLKPTEYDHYYDFYINKLSKDLDLREGFEIGKKQMILFFESIHESKLLYQYEKGKWTIKEILQHIIDTERVFMYRCFRIARRDTVSLAGYDQNIYITPSGANDKTMSALLDEYKAVRNHSISLLNSLNDKDLEFVGTANDVNMSGRSAAFTIIGHEIWHCDIIKERYL